MHDGKPGCPHARLCSMLRAHVADRELGDEYDGDWCPFTAAHRNTLKRAGITLPRADGTFDPVAVTDASSSYAARRPVEGTGIKLGEFIGWRIWTVRDAHLLSPLQGTLWPMDGLMTGDPRSGHGIFAFKERDRAINEARRVSTPWLTIAYGSVRLWGEVTEHKHGYRAEFARIDRLDGINPQDVGLKDLCAHYGIEFPGAGK